MRNRKKVSLASPGNVLRKTANPSTTRQTELSNRENRLFSEPSLTMITINIEGITKNKQEILAQLCRMSNCDIMCVQETHRDNLAHRPQVPGMRLIAEIPSSKHGSAIFVKSSIAITSVNSTNHNGIEIITTELGECTVTSIYKPPGTDFNFSPPDNFWSQKTKFVTGDFNSHNVLWGYERTDSNGEDVEQWAEQNGLTLIHDPKLPFSFNSKIWKKGYNTDICFTTPNIQQNCVKMVYDPIPKTQHRPVGINVYSVLKAPIIPFKRRFNFKKARWEDFTNQLDNQITKIEPLPENYGKFVELVKSISRKTIPRGCRQQYLPGMTEDLRDAMEKYRRLYEDDPFSEATIESGTTLLQSISEARRVKWLETLDKMDMAHSSKMAWNTIKRLCGDPIENKKYGNVTADQVAHQLLLNGKPEKTNRRSKLERAPQGEIDLLGPDFEMSELNTAINTMKNGKSPGVDDIFSEQLKHLGLNTRKWLLLLLNACARSCKIPKMWRKARVVALLKPGKDPDLPSSYRPISLLCHLFKVYERIILQRIQDTVDTKLIPEQAGFRPGKSCTSQVLNLTEFIEQGFESKNITGLALVDLTAAYDTINHSKLLCKIYKLLGDFNLVRVIQSILHNRRFYVTLQGRKSRWRDQRNGLAQGSVLAPILYNIYTNDQPITESARHFLYADDLAIAIQSRSFQDIEERLEKTLDNMSKYYRENSLKPNPAKTQVCAFHLNTRNAHRTLQIRWEGNILQHTTTPKYLGVTLDRSLTYKYHCHNTRQKVGTRNALLRKLAGSNWGASPDVLRITAQALCFSTGEYACPVWNRSTHAKNVDVALNETCRIVSGCMKPTPLDLLYKATGLGPPKDRRMAAEYTERFKQVFDERHVLYGTEIPPGRLKSRKSFLRKVPVDPPDNYPLHQIRPTGSELEWRTWLTLNRMRTGVAPVKTNRAKWGLTGAEDLACECGEIQDMEHMLVCPRCPKSCTLDDLWLVSDAAVDVARYWAKNLP